MPQTPITFTGTLGGDPELRDVGSAQVASFSVAVTERKKDGDQWVDAGTTWFRCSAWRDLGANVVASLHKGDRVFVSGTIGERTYDDREGNKKSSWEVTAEEVGPSLRFATTTGIVRAGGGSRPPAGDGNMLGRQRPAQQKTSAQAAGDRWGSYDDSTPF